MEHVERLGVELLFYYIHFLEMSTKHGCKPNWFKDLELGEKKINTKLLPVGLSCLKL